MFKKYDDNESLKTKKNKVKNKKDKKQKKTKGNVNNSTVSEVKQETKIVEPKMPDMETVQPKNTKEKSFDEHLSIKSVNLNEATFEIESSTKSENVETLKEGIAPSAIERGAIDYMKVGSKFARTFYIEGFPDYVYIGYLEKLYDTDFDLDVNLSIEPRQQSKARKELQDKLTIIKAKYEEEVESGKNRERDTYEAQIGKLEKQIADLASKQEYAFNAQLFFTLYANDKKELERHTNLLVQDLKNSDLTAQIFALRQDKAWKTVIPYGKDYVRDKKRNFNTGAVISSIPFYIPELYDDYGVFLGENIFTRNPALLDLYKEGIQNSNLNIFGASGSGKSTLVKVITMRSSLYGIKTLIIDPEGEYEGVTKSLRGGYIKLSTDVEHSVMLNIFDIEETEYVSESGENERSLELRPKYEDVLGFIQVAYPEITKGQEANVLEVIEELYLRFGFKDGDVSSLYHNENYVVSSDGKSLINAAQKKKVPQIGDLLDLMNNLVLDGTYPDLKTVYEALQPYRASKTRGIFDTQTPAELNNINDLPVIDFDISGLESSDLRSVAMYVVLSWAWEKFGKKNPGTKKRILVDEAWMMMSANIKGSEHTSAFLENMSRRIRKRNGALVIATQKVEDFSSSRQGSAIISNAHTTFLLSHEISDKAVLTKSFDLDPGVVDHIIEAEVGRTLIKQGSQLYLIKTTLFENERRLVSTSK